MSAKGTVVKYAFTKVIIFSSPVQLYRKGYITTPHWQWQQVRVRAAGISLSKTLQFLSKSFLCDGQSTVRQAVLYAGKSCLFRSDLCNQI